MRKFLPLLALAFAAGWLIRGAYKPATPSSTPAPISADVIAQYLNAGTAGPKTGPARIPSWSIDDPQAPPSGALR